MGRWTVGVALTQEISDETLCRRVAAQDEAAFDVLVARYQGRAYRLAWSLLRNADDARDVSQEAFLRIYRTVGSFRGDARLPTKQMGRFQRAACARAKSRSTSPGVRSKNQNATMCSPSERTTSASTSSGGPPSGTATVSRAGVPGGSARSTRARSPVA